MESTNKYTYKAKLVTNAVHEGTPKEIRAAVLKQEAVYEIFKGAVIPYFDFEKYYKTEKERQKDWLPLMESIFDEIKKAYGKPDIVIHTFDSSGEIAEEDRIVKKGGAFKNSFHFRVRGVGYYKCGKMVEPVAQHIEKKLRLPRDELDDSVYKNEGKWQCFRLPYTTKLETDGKMKQKIPRVLKYMPYDYELGAFLPDQKPLVDIREAESIEIRGKRVCFADWILQNIDGEELKPTGFDKIFKTIGWDAVCKNEEKPAATTASDYLKACEEFKMAMSNPVPGAEVKKEMLQKIVAIIDDKRAVKYEDWFKVVFAIRHTADANGYDALDIADEFSRRGKYDGLNSVKRKYEDADRNISDNKVLGFGSLKKWAQEDNPVKYAELVKRDVKATYYSDVRELLTKKDLTREDVEDWMLGCIVKVENSGSPTLFTRMNKREWKQHESLFKPRSTENYYLIDLKDIRLAKKKGKLYFHEIFADLQQKREFLENNVYDKIGFFPYFTEGQRVAIEKEQSKECKYFNLFGGLPVVEESVTDRLDIALNHLRDILCNGEIEFYNYMLNWLSFRVQNPTRKVGSMPAFISEQGTGKNIWWDWFAEHFFGEEYSHTVNDIDRAVQKHNKVLERKLFVIMDEIGTYGTDHHNSNILKSLLTSKKQTIEPKGVDAYTVNDYIACVLLTNNWWPLKIEGSDRRYPAVKCSSKKRGDTEYFKMLAKNLDASMAGQMLTFLLARNIDKWSPCDIPATQIRNEMKEMSQPAAVRYLLAIARGRFDENDELKKFSEEWYDEKSETQKFTSEALFNDFQCWMNEQNETRYKPPMRVFSTELGQSGLKAKKLYFKNLGKSLQGFEFSMKSLRDILKKHMNDANLKFD